MSDDMPDQSIRCMVIRSGDDDPLGIVDESYLMLNGIAVKHRHGFVEPGTAIVINLEKLREPITGEWVWEATDERQ